MILFLLVLVATVPSPARDTDGDGLRDRRDRCPSVAEDRDGFEDHDGCPDPDNDGDGLPDTSDDCPDHPEDLDGWQDHDGCSEPGRDPSEGPPEHELFTAYSELTQAVGAHLAGCEAFAVAVDGWMDDHGEAFAAHRERWRTSVAALEPGDARVLRLEMAELAYEDELTSVALTCTGHDGAMASWDRLYAMLPPRD